ncbi:hypothetical protein B0H13DRAFT_2140682 [Mycena leptocephala]|nr:hypothetical protein B0H13DRAFT_2140682 [Mycena leptocephala]
MSGIIRSRASLIPLHNFLGAWLIGLILSSVLFGVTCLQVYRYFTKHSARDPIFLKNFVALLCALDTLHLALVSHSFYSATVINFGDYVTLQTPPWTASFNGYMKIQMDVGAILSTLVQLFYAFRIYIISNKSLVFPVIIAVCAFANLGMAITTIQKAFQVKVFSQARADIPYYTSSMSIEAFCDVLVAGAMSYHLLRNKTGFKQTHKAINLLVAYSLNNGAIVMVFAICDLATFVASPSTLIHEPFYLVLVRLYALSFMSILNSRDHVREQLFSTTHAMVTIHFQSSHENPNFPVDIENGMASSDVKGAVGMPSSTI